MKKLTSALMMMLALGTSAKGLASEEIQSDSDIPRFEEEAEKFGCEGNEAKRSLWKYYIKVKDYEKALYWLEVKGGQKGFTCIGKGLAMTTSDFDYRNVTAELYHKGLGTKKDLDKAIWLYEQIGYDNAMADFIIDFIRAEKQGMTIEKLKKEAERDNPEAMALLATWYIAYDENDFDLLSKGFYFSQERLVRDDRGRKALTLLQKAEEETKNPKFQYLIGLLTHALFRENSSATRVMWYKKAADQGYPPAQYMMAYAYYFGNGTIEDKELALKYAKSACENGENKGCELYNNIINKANRKNKY